jgi:two-component system LytT family response regulator
MMKAILIADKQVIRAIQPEDIIRLESRGVYTLVFSKNKKEFVYSRNLKSVYTQLDPAIFVRIHHSHVINIQEVERYEKGRGGYVVLLDGTIIPVSFRKKSAFLEQFGEK